ncbi:heat shock protein 70 [Colletotrichum higginsianum]|nr:heat shock protein 70 [Colletotrichum higginsianum]
MVEDSEKYAETDKERKGAIEAANRADSVLNDTERALNEYAEKLDKAEADGIREKIASLREYVSKSLAGEGNATAAEIKEKTDELQVASLNLFDKMHKARAESGEQPTQDANASENKDGEKKP